ncbi:MAG: GAF domain-containing protein, partial [bacterium]|nr:GAF domain-containing protein [bacterium]
EIEVNHARLEEWTALSTKSYDHKKLIVEAEQFRLKGEFNESIKLYDKAITLAQKNKFPEDSALANELAGKCCFAKGMGKIAVTYLKEARKEYKKCGVSAKVKELDETYSEFLGSATEGKKKESVTLTNTTLTFSENSLEVLDLYTVMKALQAISGEIYLDKLLKHLIQIVIENAGAQRGVLMLRKEEQLYIEAEGFVNKKEIPVLQSILVKECETVPLTMINYVKRTLQTIVQDDAAREGDFKEDPYIKSSQSKSILCYPLSRHHEFTGILYLENNLSTSAFAKDRLEIVKLLSAQAAISLENAMLFKETLKKEEEIRQLNEGLEQKVQERTLQLEASNQELESFSYSVSHDLRAPLRSINGFSQVLLEEYSDKLDDAGKNFLNRVHASSARMGDLINDILDLSRLTRGEMTLVDFDMSVMVREILGELRGREPERKVEEVVEEGVMANGDMKLMRIALENLLGNSWKYTSKKEEAKIEFGITEQEGERVYFIRDNGAGFNMKQVDKLFGAFQRLHKETDFEGTGIGLATVQRIMNRHGARIWAEGEVDKGATFYIGKLYSQDNQEKEEKEDEKE